MKKISVFIVYAFLQAFACIDTYAQNAFPASGSAGIGTATPDASSLLDVESTTKGILIPRMTDIQRTAIVSPAVGLLVYQKNASAGFYYYNKKWIQLSPSVNRRLSNLSAGTAVNRSLQPNITGSINLGSPTKKWKNLYLSGNLQSDSAIAGNLQSKSANISSLKTTLAEVKDFLIVSGAGIFNGFGILSNNQGRDGIGVYGTGESAGLYGSSGKDGVSGYSPKWVGVRGVSDEMPGTGVLAYGVWEGIFSTGNYIGIKATGYYDAGVMGIGFSGYGGQFSSGSGWGLLAETRTGDYAGAFYGDVFTSGLYLPSDKNVKKNIQDFASAMDIINKLKPKYYEYKDDAKYAFLRLPKGDHYGLLAQDLEQVLPGLVKESAHEIKNRDNEAPKLSADGKLLFEEAFVKQRDAAIATLKAPKDSVVVKAVNYTELVPIIIKGMQEQQIQIENQQAQIQKLKSDKDQQIANLQSQVDELKFMLLKSGNSAPVSSAGYLKQNIPNPAKDNTVISYFVSYNAGSAQISLTDIKGRILKVYNVAAGEGQLNIKSPELPAGTYNYSLYVNDKRIDTRQIIIAK